jgi:A/G-specific adenine glycosylase
LTNNLKTALFSERIIRWYEYHKRDLPWRHTRDPYFIWLSEIILQQTRVVQGLPYYQKFTEHFPTVHSLAAADEQEVIRLWQGLGYYSRARNLHQTARFVANHLHGVFPVTYEALLRLKGVGAYTAAAIASFANDEAVAVVDGNVYRVLARVFGVEADILSSVGKKQFSILAQQLIPADRAAIYNQAIMEFGALQCQPVAPDCLLCPLQAECIANATGKVNILPVKSKKTKSRERFFNYVVIKQGDRIALNKRHERDIWQEMYDFYLIESEKLIVDLDDLANDKVVGTLLLNATVTPPTKITKHVLTHQRIQAQFWVIELPTQMDAQLPDNLLFYDANEADKLPKPVLISTFWKENFFT